MRQPLGTSRFVQMRRNAGKKVIYMMEIELLVCLKISLKPVWSLKGIFGQIRL